MEDRPRGRVTLGVTSGIACYRACDVVRELRRRGFRVRVVLSANAERFVGAPLFEALSEEPVGTDAFESRGLEGPYARYPHLFFARDISAFAVVPATYNLVGKLAGGIADDLLTTALAATDAPVLLFPAMNSGMYGQAALRENLERLRARGVHVVEPDSGELACGDLGEGRLPEVARICDEIEKIALERPLGADTQHASGEARSDVDISPPADESPPDRRLSLHGRRVLVTAGPTREPIDPVRFLSNPSTGAMGYALAEEAVRRGAQVLLISGPTHLEPPRGARVIRVTTHAEMREAVLRHFAEQDAIVMTAAVGDYRAARAESSKIKKDAAAWSLPLERTEDILQEVSARRPDGTLLVGFALETEQLEANARAKLLAKGLDWVVANDPLEKGAGFGSGTNRVTVLGRGGERFVLPVLAKTELAKRLWDLFVAKRSQVVGS